ncbi:MAG: hypothetical protein QW307_03620 [Thermoplasmata archaeon]
MERKKNILNKIFTPKLLIIEWSFIVLFCFFIGCSIRSQAATSQNQLPFKFDQVDNYNDWITQDIIDSIENYGLPIYDEDYVLNVIDFAFYGVEGNYNIYRGWFSLIPVNKFANTSVNQDFYNTSVSYSKVNGLNSYYFGVHFDINGGFTPIVFNVNSNYNDLGSLFGHSPNSVTILGEPYVFTSYVPAYFNKNFYSNNDNVVLEFNDVPIVDQGHATPPDLTGDNIGSDKPDIDDYIPTQPTAPTFDNSSLESMVESLYNWLKWEYNAITSTLKGLINYVGDTITYSIQKVIDNIKNAIQNFYDNMKSLFEPLLNGMAEIAQGIKSAIENIGALLEAFFAPFDEDQFEEAYNNCQFISAVDDFKDSIEEFEHAFEYAEERDYYTLYLGFIMDGYTVNYDLDFTWLYQLRQYYRPIIWCVVVYEFFVYLCAQLSDYLQGRSGK